jgi:tetratricopeptide (TPR) repeat protein
MDSTALAAPLALEALVQQAIAEHRTGRSTLATALYRAVLDTCPSHPEANHNLGILLLQTGDLSGALELFRTALENDADRELYWVSYARALLLARRPADAVSILKEGKGHVLRTEAVDALLRDANALLGAAAAPDVSDAPICSFAAPQASALAARGDLDAAITRLRSAIAQGPQNADQLLLQLGDMLAQSGAIGGAIDALEQAIALNPSLAEAHFHLGSLLSENERVADGFSHLMRHAQLAQGNGGDEPESAHKIKHDREQVAHLAAKGLIGTSPERLALHLADGSRIGGPAVNPSNAGPDLQRRWTMAIPKFLVIDNFLTPEALEKLRNFCAESTVWKRVYDAGYIGATPADGFACPLLAQIAEEIRSLYNPVLSGYPFRYLGAFKYDSELSSGTNTHADFSAVNVNLYIAPDEANLAPDCGGMVIWNLQARTEAELRYYNGNEEALRGFIEASGASMHRIPHRANRAVIFESGLFHRTDDCSFKEGYLNKRINVSFLFGDWVDSPA